MSGLKKRKGEIAFLDYDGVPGRAKKIEGIIRDLNTAKLYNFNVTMKEYNTMGIEKGSWVTYVVSGGEASISSVIR